MAYFRCTTGGSGKGNTLVVTCADDLAGATITCTNGTKTYTKTCPSTAPYEVTFYGLEAGTYTVSATVSGNTYTTTVVVVDCAALLGGFNWRTWVDTAQFLDSSDYDSLSEVLEDELAIRELCLEHACVDYLADIATANEDVETIIENDLFAKWVNNSDYALDFLGANVVIKALMDEADKYFYGEWALVGQVPKMTSNTAPYGVASASSVYSTDYAAYGAFTGRTVYGWMPSTSSLSEYVQYQFPTATKISKVWVGWSPYTSSQTSGKETVVKIVASNDGSTWEDFTDNITLNLSDKKEAIVDAIKTTSFAYYRMAFVSRGSSTAYNDGTGFKLQFYSWAPKGNVPIMTANNAPYGEVVGSSVLNSGTYYYSAFDGDESSVWHSAAGMPQYIGYKATNPIKLKACRVVVPPVSASYPNTKETFKIQGSNDGFVNDVHDLTEAQEIAFRTDGISSVLWVEVDSEDYYLHHRVYVTDSTYQSASYKYAQFREIQFYGRELSVSVPKMDTNTTPYGEASASAEFTGYSAYKAFDGTNTGEGDSWYSQGVKTGYLRYKFTAPCCVKFVTMRNRNYGSTADTAPSNFEIRGSNDNFVSDDNLLGTFTNTNTASNGFSKYDITNNDEYLYYEIKVLGTVSANNVSIGQLQFYGLDYSEKEFEEGTTKKWLYDHGVELEEYSQYTSNGSITKENSYVKIQSTANSAFCYLLAKNVSNLGDYNLIRCKMGAVYKQSSSDSHFIDMSVYSITNPTTKEGSRVSNAYMMPNDAPNNFSLAISSVSNGNYAAIVLGESNRTKEMDITEWWLE